MGTGRDSDRFLTSIDTNMKWECDHAMQRNRCIVTLAPGSYRNRCDPCAVQSNRTGTGAMLVHRDIGTGTVPLATVTGHGDRCSSVMVTIAKYKRFTPFVLGLVNDCAGQVNDTM